MLSSEEGPGDLGLHVGKSFSLTPRPVTQSFWVAVF